MRRKLGFCFVAVIAMVLSIGCASSGDMNKYLGEVPSPQKIIPLENQNASTLFSKTLSWASNTFVSAKDAIEITDKDSGLIAIRTNFQSTSYKLGIAIGGEYYITYKIRIEIKDNKSRITCANPMFEVLYKGSIKTMNDPSAGMMNEYVDQANKTITGYEAYMLKSSDSW